MSSDALSRTPSPTYRIAVCIDCDRVRPESTGGELDVGEYGKCPECGAALFGLLRTEIVDVE